MGSEGEQELIKMMRNILSGLKYLHQRSLVHLDLKPSNLFVRRGVYKIGDLGHITQQKKHRRGSSSSLNTTPSEGDCCYMAKELLNFDPRNPLDLRKCDIFSLGASMYEIIRGVRLPSAVLVASADSAVSVVSACKLCTWGTACWQPPGADSALKRIRPA